jgi:hypothetical protein
METAIMGTINWHERAQALRIDGRCVIEGQRRERQRQTFACTRPSTAAAGPRGARPGGRCRCRRGQCPRRL